MFRVALRPRFLGLLALMVLATVVCGFLANWQWDRAHRAMQARESSSQSVGQLEDVLDLGSPVTNDLVGRTVIAHGTFDPSEQVLVPDRNIDGTRAAIVVTALHVRQADGSEARLPVARGWVPEKDVTGADGKVDPSLAPAADEGKVEITGRLEASEAATSGAGDGTASEIATPMLVNAWGEPMYTGFLADTSPSDPALHPLPPAQSEFSKGLNWQNLGYAAQWIVFGAFFLYLWWRSVRSTYNDERDDARRALEARLGGGPTGGDPPSGEGTDARPVGPDTGAPAPTDDSPPGLSDDDPDTGPSGPAGDPPADADGSPVDADPATTDTHPTDTKEASGAHAATSR
jgi:cytochrome oxidase assembly protein ShyY1